MKRIVAFRIQLLIPLALMIGTSTTILHAQTYTPLYTYPETVSGNTGILAPGLMSQGQDGAFYTTDTSNGANSKGSAFKMTTGGSPTTLYSFCSLTSCTDGLNPYGGVTLGFDGNLYGTTLGGGMFAAGTVFKIAPTGAWTKLWDFDNMNDDSVPFYPLLQGQDGNFYGVSVGQYNTQYGAFFRIAPSGAFTTLADFDYTNGDAGVNPAYVISEKFNSDPFPDFAVTDNGGNAVYVFSSVENSGGR